LIELSGEYYDGVTTASLPAKLRAYEGYCQLIGDGLALDFQLADASVSAPIADLPRRITWGTAASFVTPDSAQAESLAAMAGGSTVEQFANRIERIWPLAVLGLVFVAVVYAAVLIFGVPAAAKRAALSLPDSVLETAAEQGIAAIDELYVEPSALSEQRQQQLREYLRSFDDTGKPILFRAGGEGVGANAFAMVGGYIVFTDELIELAEDDREVLGVYLHEVGHARLRHAETSILQNASWLVLLTLMTGDVSGVSGYISSLPLIIGQLAFSRELETDADTYAIEAMLKHGIDPDYLATILEKLALGKSEGEEEGAEVVVVEDSAEASDTELVLDREESGWTDYLSSHPAPSDRIARLREAK